MIRERCTTKKVARTMGQPKEGKRQRSEVKVDHAGHSGAVKSSVRMRAYSGGSIGLTPDAQARVPAPRNARVLPVVQLLRATDYASAAVNRTSGSFFAICSNRRAAPLGFRRPTSQLASVTTGTFSSRAKTA